MHLHIVLFQLICFFLKLADLKVYPVWGAANDKLAHPLRVNTSLCLVLAPGELTLSGRQKFYAGDTPDRQNF